MPVRARCAWVISGRRHSMCDARGVGGFLPVSRCTIIDLTTRSEPVGPTRNTGRTLVSERARVVLEATEWTTVINFRRSAQ